MDLMSESARTSSDCSESTYGSEKSMLALPLLGDRHGRRTDVALTRDEDRTRLQRVEAHVLHGDLEIELLGDRREEIDVESGVLDVAGRVLDLEGRGRERRSRP